LGLISHWEKTVANCHNQIAKMNTTYKQPIDRLKRHMAEYQPQLKRDMDAIAITKSIKGAAIN